MTAEIDTLLKGFSIKEIEDILFHTKAGNKNIDNKKLSEEMETSGFQPGALRNEKNLHKIASIGTFHVFVLNKLGIFSFEQIAKWKKADIEAISKDISPFSNQRKIDNWVTQARKLNNLKLDQAKA